MIGDHRVLAVVIARAGSKGLPGKNALPLAGRPMICHAIDDALATEAIDRVIVSTDGAAIAAAAESMGVEVVMRPESLADDNATVDAAVRHAVEAIDDNAAIIVILYGNVPVRPENLITRALERLHEAGCDSVQSYCDVGKHHPWWMITLDDSGRVAPHVKNAVYRRQDLPELFIPDGGVIAVTRESLLRIDPDQPHAFLGEDRRGVRTEPGDVIDVDTAADLAVAEAALTTGAPA